MKSAASLSNIEHILKILQKLKFFAKSGHTARIPLHQHGQSSMIIAR